MTSAKYIGMDVHKESVSIAVLNFAGKVVMECVIETKASTILQFIHGLRGDLQVTFEEGTWAGWLYDLLKPHVTELVVCNPRKIALLKDGSKSDRIDAHKLADLLYMNKIKPVYHGEHGPAHVEGIVPQLFDDQQGSRAGDESAQGLVSELGHTLCRDASLRTALPFGMVEQDQRSWRAPAGGTLLPTTRRPAAGAPTSPEQRSCYARFLVLVRFERLTWLP
jgi:transposase